MFEPRLPPLSGVINPVNAEHVNNPSFQRYKYRDILPFTWIAVKYYGPSPREEKNYGKPIEWDNSEFKFENRTIDFNFKDCIFYVQKINPCTRQM